MKKLIALILVLAASDNVIGQIRNRTSNYFLDSARYYFHKSLNNQNVDESIYIKGLRMLDSLSMNDEEIKQLEKIADEFIPEKNYGYGDEIQNVIFETLKKINMERAAAYGISVLNSYEESRDPKRRSSFLRMLTKPLSPSKDFYTDKLENYLAAKDSDAVSIVYWRLSVNYEYQGLFEHVVYYLKKSISYLKMHNDNSGTITGLWGISNHTGLIGRLYMMDGDYPNAIRYSKEANRQRIEYLKDSSNIAFTSCNIAYAKLMINQTDSVLAMLQNALKLANKHQDFPCVARAYEMMGFYYLKVNKFDSSAYFIDKCKQVMMERDYHPFSPAAIHTPNYFLAQVRIKQNRLKEAKKLIEEELSTLVKAGANSPQLTELKLLIEICIPMGDLAAADSVFRKFISLQEKLKIDNRINRALSFETEEKINKSESIISTLESDRKLATVIRNSLIGIAGILLLVAIVIFNRFRVTRRQKVIIEKEKKRSEELLLNILPAEVAEELKEKGSAEAKLIDEATVLFTDFKGFTQLSEKLTPKDLVSEINECFSSFDYIMQKYGIEKIKTIGDSYMAAGGLPVPNQSHAVDVVKAALEINKWMKAHKIRKEKEGSLFFEIRIGVHTGPVVAGIVGVKKFAYDIWGDTVNTASRMESSGEAGQVNISGNTYELVKNEFNCIYRGKISAKGKGETDMYFVNEKL